MGIKTVQDTSLTSVANAIRVKAEISGTLEFPDEFVSAIQNISTGITPSGTKTITENGTYDVTNFASADVNVSGGGGGNLVSGSFKATEDGVLNISLPYIGTGYPIALIIYVKDGYNASDNTDFYDLVSSGAMCVWGAIKSYPNVAPNYAGTGTANGLDAFHVRKNSSSNAHQYTAQTSANTALFRATEPFSSWNNLISIPSATSMKVFANSTGLTFRPNVEYAYHIIYSS